MCVFLAVFTDFSRLLLKFTSEVVVLHGIDWRITYFADIQFDFRYGFLIIRNPLLNVDTLYKNVSRIKRRR
jgi:hypothetical protein